VGRLTSEGSRWERSLSPVALSLVLAVAAYGLWVAFVGYYVEIGWSLRDGGARLLAWSPFPRWVSLGVGGLLFALALVALGVTVRDAVRGRGREVPPAAPLGGPEAAVGSAPSERAVARPDDEVPGELQAADRGAAPPRAVGVRRSHRPAASS
jgi:hypothetical protein